MDRLGAEYAGASQAETQTKLQGTLELLSQQTHGLLTSLNDSQRKAFDSNHAREEATSTRSAALMSSLTGSIDLAVTEIATASQNMIQAVSSLTSATGTTIDKLNLGADRINTAATNFSAAGDRVTQTIDASSRVSGQLAEISTSLTAGASTVQEALRDYRTQRESLAALLVEVKGTIEIARRDASVSSDVVTRIEQAAARLGEAHQAADEYMNGVTDVLAKSSDAFSSSVVSTLSRVNTSFHEKLSTAVGLLSSAVQELDVSLSSLGSKK